MSLNLSHILAILLTNLITLLFNMQNSVKTPNKTPRPIKSFRIASDAENFVAYVISRTPDFDFTTWINELIRKESKRDPMFNPTKNYRK